MLLITIQRLGRMLYLSLAEKRKSRDIEKNDKYQPNWPFSLPETYNYRISTLHLCCDSNQPSTDILFKTGSPNLFPLVLWGRSTYLVYHTASEDVVIAR